MSDSAAELAGRIAELERQIAQLSLASQISRSTVSVDGVDVAVPDAIGQGADAAALVGQAQSAADDALAQAALAQVTADGRNRIFATDTEPAEDMVQGDLWYVLNETGAVIAIRVFDGAEWNLYSLVANSVLVPSSVGAVLIADGAITAPKIDAESITADKFVVGALDGQTLRGAYIEGAVIASSDAVGAGVNVLADPGFTSALDTAWVASGYLGTDPIPVQTDTITWDQTANNPNGKRVRYRGSIIADMTVKPIVRQTRELLHTHASAVFSTAARTATNPYTFGNTDSGSSDSAFSKPLASVGAAPAASPSTRTSYLTNSTVISVTAGQSWQAIIKFTPMYERASQAEVSMQLVDATTGAVVWDRPLTLQEKEFSAQVVGVFIAASSAKLRFRLASTYRAAGAGIQRLARAGSFRRADRVDTDPLDQDYLRTMNGYGIVPLSGNDWPAGNSSWEGQVSDSNSLELMRRAGTRFTLQSASFGTRSPVAGFTLQAETGLELFNDAGATTARLNGVDNFLAGVFATSESGQRVQLDTTRVAWFNNAGVLVTELVAADVALLRNKPQATRHKLVSQTFPTNAWTIVTWPTGITLRGITYNPNGTFTVVTAGDYLISAQVAFEKSNLTGQRTARIELNGNQVAMSNQMVPQSTAYPTIPSISLTLALQVGDTIAFAGFQSAGAAIGTDTESGKSFFSMVRL